MLLHSAYPKACTHKMADSPIPNDHTFDSLHLDWNKLFGKTGSFFCSFPVVDKTVLPLKQTPTKPTAKRINRHPAFLQIRHVIFLECLFLERVCDTTASHVGRIHVTVGIQQHLSTWYVHMTWKSVLRVPWLHKVPYGNFFSIHQALVPINAHPAALDMLVASYCTIAAV